MSGDFSDRTSLWHRLINEATTTEEVLHALRDYVDSLTPQQLSHLPHDCRPGRIKADDDVAYWTVVLSRHECNPSNDEGKVILQDALDHFLHGFQRSYQIIKQSVEAEAKGSKHPGAL
jgi:hypothetical protein